MALTRIKSENIESSGDLSIDNNTLYVDVTNNRVGIGISPSYKLDVSGNAMVRGTIYITNTNGVVSSGDGSGWMFSGSGYVYLNQSGYTYSQSRIVARGGISDDSNTALTLYGGTGGYTQINGSTRSPIFYDSDNTGYYFDGSSTTRIAGELQIITAANQMRLVQGNYGLIFRNDGSAFYLLPTASSDQYGSWSSLRPFHFNLATGDMTNEHSIKTPIVYDANDTGYYCNPNGTSILNAVSMANMRPNVNTWHTSYTDSANRFYFSNSGRTYFGSLDGYEWRSLSDGNIGFLDNSGNFYNYASVRAPIFYDSDNTGYYSNPAGLSVFVQLGLYGTGSPLYFDRAAGNYAYMRWHTSSSTRFDFGIDSGAESGSNVGSDLFINTFSDAGAYIGTAMMIRRAGAYAEFPYSVRTPIFYDNNNTGYYVDPAGTTSLETGYFNTDGFTLYNNRWLRQNDSSGSASYGIQIAGSDNSFRMKAKSGTNMYINVDVNSTTLINYNNTYKTQIYTGTSYYHEFSYNEINTYNSGTATTMYLQYNTAALNISSSSFVVSYPGWVEAQRGYRCRYGTLGAYRGNYYNIDWDGTYAYLYIDNTNVGYFYLLSDYRIKKNITTIEYTALDKVMQMRPVTYNIKDVEIWKDDNKKKAGFIAHELQEIIPEAVIGEKDQISNDGNIKPQMLDPIAIISVLTKALQEAISKIESLESRITTLEGN